MTNTFLLPFFQNYSKVKTQENSTIAINFATTTDPKYFFQGTIINKILFRDLMVFLNEVVEARF